MSDDYTNGIDWDLIYRVFHCPEKIAGNIRSVLGNIDGPLIFCGFPEVAAHLSVDYDVYFVDYSQSIVESSRARYPEINQIVRAEISEFLGSNPAKYIVISGRLSAFWQTEGAFQQLANALLAYPRTQVLIDYFDSENIAVDMRTSFAIEQGVGDWHYQAIETMQPADHLSHPAISKVKLGIRYTVGSMGFSYISQRAYFDKQSIEAWHKHVFDDYDTSVLAGLLDDDPSFAINMQSCLQVLV